MSTIHPTAVIEPGAEIGPDCSVGAYSVIGPHVVIGAGTSIGSHVVVEGHTRIGSRNQIFQFASVGSIPQDLKFHGEPSTLTIGDENVIREYVTLQPGTEHGGMRTEIGSSNLFMACSHVGHDALVGDRNVFANSCALAGHVEVGSGVILGGLVGIHQHVRLGDLCLIGAGAMVARDIPPFCIAQGDRAGLVGLNKIGLERSGISAEEIATLKRFFRKLYFGDQPQRESRREARELFGASKLVCEFLDFIEGSKRGVSPVRRRAAVDD